MMGHVLDSEGVGRITSPCSTTSSRCRFSAIALEIQRWSPHSPVVLIGFSLGGNIVLKLAGELQGHPLPSLERVAAVAPPIDLERCVRLLSLPRNRFYEMHFLRDLIDQARR